MKITYPLALQKLKQDSADKKVLELLNATRGFQIEGFDSLSAKQLLVVAERLEITEASVRMALSRQTKQGKLIREHGFYRLKRTTQPFTLPRFWLDIRNRPRNWQGDWYLFNLGEHKFTPTIMRRLNRKLALLGMVLVPYLGWLRPANLEGLHEELLYHASFVTGERQFFTATIRPATEDQHYSFTALWPTDTLNQFYQETLSYLDHEIEKLEALSDQDILVRSFANGRLVVDALAKDPWLPAQMIDIQSRTALVERATQYYAKIKPAWLRVLQSN